MILFFMFSSTEWSIHYRSQCYGFQHCKLQAGDERKLIHRCSSLSLEGLRSQVFSLFVFSFRVHWASNPCIPNSTHLLQPLIFLAGWWTWLTTFCNSYAGRIQEAVGWEFAECWEWTKADTNSCIQEQATTTSWRFWQWSKAAVLTEFGRRANKAPQDVPPYSSSCWKNSGCTWPSWWLLP